MTNWARFILLLFSPSLAWSQIDPIKRDLIQLGYNASMQGHAPLAGYAFYYHNDPGFWRTNLTLRAAVAPVYLDAELGISDAFGENTDLGIGVAGGGFADSYSEIRGGKYRPSESFTGHGVEVSASLYHLFNPEQRIPLNLVVRGSLHHSFYERDSDTDDAFMPPDDQTMFTIRNGLRWGGREPTLFPSLAMELSLWYEGQFRNENDEYGFGGDREIRTDSHLFWVQALLAYTFPESQHNFYVSLTAGESVNPDRFSAYRLGALLPLVAEFPLSLPGYYYEEISARRFVLFGGNYLMPLDKQQRWNWNISAATAAVDYAPGQSQPGHWHSGVGTGILYTSPSNSVKIMLSYAYGVDAIRDHDRGAHSIGILIQLDLSRAGILYNPQYPNRWRGWKRMLGI